MIREAFATALAAVLLCASHAPWAQTAGADPNVAAPFGSPVEDQRIYVHGTLEQFEVRNRGGRNDPTWDGQLWAGTDLNRLWIKSEGRVNSEGRVEDGIHEALYSRAITSFFDLQLGIRYDLDSAPSRGWAAFGIQGLAPYFLDVEATAYVSDSGHFAGRLRGTYDLLITQRLILQPDVELNFYSKSDRARDVGPGLSELDAGIRLRYEITRKLAPYLGVSYRANFGPTARFVRSHRESAEDFRFVLGFRAWF